MFSLFVRFISIYASGLYVALGLSCDFTSVSEETLNDVGEMRNFKTQQETTRCEPYA